MRPPLVLLSAIVLALAGSPAAAGAANTFAGTWDSDFGPLTLDAGGSGSYQGFNPGTVTGHVTGNVDEGTWHQPGTPPKQGTFKFTLGFGGRSFTGVWAYDSGGCGTACGWNGHCVAGPCLSNGTASTSCGTRAHAAAGNCATLLAPHTQRPALGETTSYKPPSPGGTSTYSLPTVPRGKTAVTGELRFVDDQGRRVEGPDIFGIEDSHAQAAAKLCIVLIYGPLLAEVDEYPQENTDALGKCLDTVARVLARADQIKRQRGQARAARRTHAAGVGCKAFSLPKAPSTSRSLLRVGCRRTAHGARVTFTSRSKRMSLRKALRLQKPKIVVARSALSSQSTVARLDAHWSAK